MLVAPICGSRRRAALIEREPSISSSRRRFLDQSFANPYGIAFLFARDDENETVPETYSGVDDAQQGGCAAVVATAVVLPSPFVNAMQSASESQLALFGFVLVNWNSAVIGSKHGVTAHGQ